MMKVQDYFSKADIIKGLELKQFEVYYQPIIDKSSDSILSGEALVRWNHPQRGFLHPQSFIGAAEETGAIIPLGAFVLHEACQQSEQWKREGYPFYKVTINLSLAQFVDEHFVEKVKDIINETQVDPQDIELEITETIAMVDPDATRSMLLALKDLGLRLMLDDFGTGYSSLSHLRRFPVDGIKIDRQFIEQCIHSDRDCKLIQAIILLAKVIDLDIVAEGIETKEQLVLLQSMDCHVMQGFYFSHPLPAREYREWCGYFIDNPALRM